MCYIITKFIGQSSITAVYISRKAKKKKEKRRVREREQFKCLEARREGANKNIVITTNKRLIAATSFIVSSFNHPAGIPPACHASVFHAIHFFGSSEVR